MPYDAHKHTPTYICTTREIQSPAEHHAFCKGQLEKPDEKHTEKRPDPDILSQDMTQHLRRMLEPREEGRSCSPSRKKRDHLWVL